MITTLVEMIEAVKMGTDKTAAFETAAFESDEIVYWLNEAQIVSVKQKVFGNNFRKQELDDYSTGFKRPDDLSRLIYYSEFLWFDGSHTDPDFRPHAYHPNIAAVNIDNNPRIPHYLFYIGCDFKATKDSTWVFNGDYVNPNEPSDSADMPPMETQAVEMKDIGFFVETPYNKPFLKNAFIYLKEGEVNAMYDPYLYPVWLRVSYLYEPKKLTLNPTGAWESDLTGGVDEEGTVPVQMRTEIVKTAVNMMLENIADPRYQSHTVELSKME